MTTPLEIATEALDAVAAEMQGVVQTGTLVQPSKSGFDPITAERVIDDATVGTLRCVFVTERPVSSVFPEYVAGPTDQLVFAVGSVTPQEGWTLRLARDFEILRVQDILNTGGLFYMVVR